MTSINSAYNNHNPSTKKKSKEKITELPKKPEPRSTLITPIFSYPQLTLNPKPFGSHISEKNNNLLSERFNSFHSLKSNQDNEFLNQNPFSTAFKNINFGMPMMSWQFPSFNFMNSQSKEENQNIPIQINPKQFMLNRVVNENEEFYKDKKEEDKNKISDNNNSSNEEKNSSEKTSSPEKNNINHNNNGTYTGTKFFTNHNYGYKCSCSKTLCNRKYCECFNSGNYCVDCNCKNCKNKPPVNSYTNKHPTDELTKSKKEKVICTCTKSGCNKNYCECFKLGQKCTSLCRCISCENNDQIQIKKIKYNYKCDSANSIYIIKNKICVENLKDKIKDDIYGEAAPVLKYDFVGICKKRKREENKTEDEINYNNNKNKKIENKEENNLFNDSLFDQNGKVILRHINLFQI